MHPEAPASQFDNSHAHIGGHVAEAKRLFLLKRPHAAALHLNNMSKQMNAEGRD